jgi:hypothetical protein
MDEHIPRDVPFTLSCALCDVGQEIESYEEAVAQGWTSITYAPDLASVNFVGLCPDCLRWQEELDAQADDEEEE